MKWKLWEKEMNRNYNFHQSCYRYKQEKIPDINEKHPCFFCGSSLSLSVNKECKKCGIMICPECNNCLCTISDIKYFTLTAIHEQFCCHLDKYTGFIVIEGDREIIETCEEVLTNCFLLQFGRMPS